MGTAIVTVTIAVPIVLGAAAVEVWVSPHLLFNLAA